MSGLLLTNPHSVLAALKARPKDVLEVQVSGGRPEGAWEKVVEMAQQRGIPVTMAERGPKMKGKEKSGRVGGYAAQVLSRGPVSLGEMFAATRREDREPLFVAMDCLQDPHNVGAIFRTAAFFGVAGILMSKDRSAPLNHTVYDVASGGMEVVPYTIVTNLSRAFDEAKKAGIWLLGTSEHAEKKASSIQADRRWMLVIGNEESGLRRLTQDLCDEVCAIPAQTSVDSLNASVAAGIMIAHLSGI